MSPSTGRAPSSVSLDLDRLCMYKLLLQQRCENDFSRAVRTGHRSHTPQTGCPLADRTGQSEEFPETR